LQNSIEIRDLYKSYRGKEAVKGVSFTVKKGEFLALLGPNGAGKSSIINILCTCLKADGGSVLVDGLKVGYQDFEIRKKIGVVFQNGVLDDLLTVEENLYTRGRFYGYRKDEIERRIASIAEMTGISEFLTRPYAKLSGGQKRRCDIARALLHFPKILLLDEPTTGLDPQMRAAIWKTIFTIKEKTDMTILLTTHYMEESSGADKIIILKDGKILVKSTPDRIKEMYAADSLVLFSESPALLRGILDRKGIRYAAKGEGIEIALKRTNDALPILELCRGRYSGFEVLRGSMDDAYLKVIERGVVDAKFCISESGFVF